MKKFERILALIYLLKRHREGLGIAAIANELGVTERTVYRDLAALPEIYQGFFYVEYSDGGYRLSASAYAPPLHLSPDELSALQAVAEAAAPSTPHGQRVKQAVSKVTSVYEQSRQLLPLDHLLTISPTVIRDRASWKVLDHLEGAIKDRAELQIDYYSFSRRVATHHLFRPYALAFRKQAWYVVGYSCTDQGIRTLRAARIQHLARTGAHFDRPEHFSPEDYFRESWEVFTGQPVSIRLLFSPRVVPLVQEMQWHPKQELEPRADGSVLFSAPIPLSPELSSWILSWGSDCEVLEPQGLRGQIASEVAKLGKIYRNS
jgi:predicted DNA-binding transcriptional regulator YafY